MPDPQVPPYAFGIDLASSWVLIDGERKPKYSSKSKVVFYPNIF